MKWMIAVLCGLIAFPALAESGGSGPDYEREQRIEKQIADGIFDGEVIHLEANDHQFMAIDMEPEVEKKGAVIITHGRGLHADWDKVTHPLRVGLAERGWRTLSLQMPVLAKGESYYAYEERTFGDADKRIAAAIKYLRDAGEDKVIIAAHSCGAHQAMHYVRLNGDAAIDAYVGIGMGATDAGEPVREPFPLDTMHVPVLDISGSDEYPSSLSTVKMRREGIERAGNPKSQIIVLPGADHYFHGKEDEMIEQVSAWLNGLF